jgi:NADPH-dependent curcumin reductase CurA
MPCIYSRPAASRGRLGAQEDDMNNRRIVLASRPTGTPRPENFELIEQPLPEAGDGEILVENQAYTLDAGSAPAAFIRLTSGQTSGKTVVRAHERVGTA